MKRLITLLTAILAVSIVNAQTQETIATFKLDDGGEELTLKEGKKSGDIGISIAGFDITLSGRESSLDEDDYISPRLLSDDGSATKTILGSNCQLGFASLTSPAYPSSDPMQSGFLALDQKRSYFSGCDVLAVETPINPSKTILLRCAWTLNTQVLRLNNSLTLTENGGRPEPVITSEPYEMSSIYMANSGLAVSTPIRLTKDMLLIPGVFVEGSNSVATWRDSQATYTRSLETMPNYGYGATLQLTYKQFGLFARYNINPLFKRSTGLKTNLFSIGISLL